MGLYVLGIDGEPERVARGEALEVTPGLFLDELRARRRVARHDGEPDVGHLVG